MKIINISKSLTDLWWYINAGLKARRIKSDWEKMRAEWNAIGGFNAPAPVLLAFMDKYSLLLVEYATWTPTEMDDNAVAVIRCVITDHRDIVIHLIDWVRKGYNPTQEELLGMVKDVSNAATDEYGDPMTALYIISILYNALRFLRDQQIIPVVLPDTTIIDPPQPVKRPVINFIRTIFGKK